MAQNSTQITRIAFSEIKAEKKQLLNQAENQGKMLFCRNFNRNEYTTCHVGEFQGPLEGEKKNKKKREKKKKTFSGYNLACRPSPTVSFS